MKTVAFLQNAWFKQPERMRRIYERMAGDNLDKIAELNATYLFFRCLTGKRLKRAFGEDLCREIVWENANPGFVGESSGKLPPDPAHIRRVLDHFKPEVVLVFGALARAGVCPICNEYDIYQITGPHPAARGEDVIDALSGMASAYRDVLATRA